MTPEEVNLTREQKEIVVETARSWPKSLDAVTLLKSLDKLAKKILAITKE